MRLLRAYGVELTLVALLGLAVLFFGYLALGLLPTNVVDDQFSGERAIANIRSQLSFGARGVGTRNSLQTGEWLVQQLTGLGWDVIIQEFDIGGGVLGRNYIAVRSPTTPAAPVGILATHYDTRLAADADPNELYRTRPTPGANSGASGVATLLELARTLDVEKAGHTLCLVFLDAEENAGIPGWEGQVGSRVFADEMEEDALRCASPTFVVALDQVGGVDQQFFYQQTNSPGLSTALWQAADEAGFGDVFIPEVKGDEANVHTVFAQAGVPAALIADVSYPYRYTMSDTLDKLSADSLRRVGRTLESWLEQGARFNP